MVNLRVLNSKKKYFQGEFDKLEKKDFKLYVELGSFSDFDFYELKGKEKIKKEFEVLKTNTKEYNKFLTDLNIDFKNKKEFILDEDSELKLGGVGEIDFYIIKDIDLKISYFEEIFNFLKINFYLLKGIKVNFKEEFGKNINLFKEVEYFLDENSELIKRDFIYSSEISFSNYFLNKNSKLNLKGAYLIENKKAFLRNNIYNLDENSKAFVDFNGAGKSSEIINDILIRIENKADNSKGVQKTQNIILDEKTKILTEPILEIYNSNVECSHGDSTYEIDKDILYYMESRGISKDLAINLIVNGFFEKL